MFWKVFFLLPNHQTGCFWLRLFRPSRLVTSRRRCSTAPWDAFTPSVEKTMDLEVRAAEETSGRRIHGFLRSTGCFLFFKGPVAPLKAQKKAISFWKWEIFIVKFHCHDVACINSLLIISYSKVFLQRYSKMALRHRAAHDTAASQSYMPQTGRFESILKWLGLGRRAFLQVKHQPPFTTNIMHSQTHLPSSIHLFQWRTNIYD